MKNKTTIITCFCIVLSALSGCTTKDPALSVLDDISNTIESNNEKQQKLLKLHKYAAAGCLAGLKATNKYNDITTRIILTIICNRNQGVTVAIESLEKKYDEEKTFYNGCLQTFVAINQVRSVKNLKEEEIKNVITICKEEYKILKETSE